ncbi:hypothetical protein AKJ16_DCAP13853 [Drosera capensis]
MGFPPYPYTTGVKAEANLEWVARATVDRSGMHGVRRRRTWVLARQRLRIRWLERSRWWLDAIVASRLEEIRGKAAWHGGRILHGTSSWIFNAGGINSYVPAIIDPG